MKRGVEPTPPTYPPGTKVGLNGWIILRRVAGAFVIVVDAYTYWKDNKNYEASVLYAKIHDNYNDQVEALDGKMQQRTEYCVYSQNRANAAERHGQELWYETRYAGINNWLAYPVIPKGVVTIYCVTKC